MPVVLGDLDLPSWEEGESFINELEFYYSTPSPMAQAGGSDIWGKLELEDALLSPFQPTPLEDWDSDQVLNPDSPGSPQLAGGVLFHDCMWAGHCLASEHDTPRTVTPPSCLTSKRPEDNNCDIKSGAIGRTVQNPPAAVTNSSNSGNNNNSNSCNADSRCTSNNSSSNNSGSLVNSSNVGSSVTVQTVEVASACGTTRRTGVIVQKTVGRSLLIRSRTKQEVSSVSPRKPARSSRPETPQSLSESEDDSCPLDPSVFQNIDNLRPPQGDLWDEVLAAVEQEQANGILPPLPPATPPPPPLSPAAPTPPPEVKSSPVSISATTTVVTDHSYDKHAWIRLEDLGVQTPSDSEEEEIDVVSLIEGTRAATCRTSGGALPTKPSAKDRQQLQQITTSKLMSASRAVSRKMRAKAAAAGKVQVKKRRRSSESEDRIRTRPAKRPRIYCKPTRSRFATEFEPDSKEKRDMHNNMERQRRIDLRNSFEELRALVPSLSGKERAPKVVILQDAAGYCTDLKMQSRQLASQVTALRREQERLRATVSGLRRSLAAHR